MSAALLQVEAVCKRFGGFAALSDVSVAAHPGERLGIIGPNGSGKTTLINCIAGALRHDSGSIRFAGRELTSLAAHQRTRLGIARSFQIPRPFASMTVAENVAVPLEYAGRRNAPSADVHAEARAILARMGLGDKAETSAGALTQVDLRKLELARAVAARPQLLILDEVMAGLSAAEVDEVLEILFALGREGTAIVMIEHIMRAIMRFSERVLCLDEGRVIAAGTPAEVVGSATVQRIYLGA